MAEEKSKETVAQPEKKFRAGGITATVWKNEGKKDGKDYSFQSVGIERSYKDKDGEWQKTSTYRQNDLPKVVLVANLAYEFISLSEDKEE